jgi:hypothetical protein
LGFILGQRSSSVEEFLIGSHSLVPSPSGRLLWSFN